MNTPPTGTINKRRQEALTALNHFYANPVARVSMELFLTIGLVLLLAIFAIQPTINTMSELIKEIETKEKLEKDLTQKVAALQTAQTQLSIAQNRLTLLEEALPTNPEVIFTTKLIEKMAADSKILINNLSIAEIPKETSGSVPVGPKSKKNLRLIVNVTGDYPAIRLFVEAIKNSRRSLIVESVIFTIEEDRGAKNLKSTLTINAPYFGAQ